MLSILPVTTYSTSSFFFFTPLRRFRDIVISCTPCSPRYSLCVLKREGSPEPSLCARTSNPQRLDADSCESSRDTRIRLLKRRGQDVTVTVNQ
eukprot:6969671-Pyramimonas_sp.AAC.1